jgi:hypothetical protein
MAMDSRSDDFERVQGVDVEDIMARVRAKIAANRKVDERALAPLATSESEPQRRAFDDRVYRALHQARLLSGRPPAAQRVEYRTAVIGAAWAVVRRRIHQEIQVHIDSLTRHQISFNSQIARALTHLVDDLDQMDLKSGADDRVSQAQAIADLVNQVRELTERVHSLETRLNQTGERTTGGKSDQ